MTLDEAIKHAEEVAEEKENEAQDLEYSKLDWKYEANQCSKCSEEHRQLAKWLRELKQLREQTCEDTISRQEVINAIYQNCIYENEYNLTASHIKELVQQMPSVTPKEKTGHWVKTPKAVMGEGYMWYCDKCEHQVYQDTSRPYPSEKYCPDCGCHMIEPQESEDKE